MKIKKFIKRTLIGLAILSIITTILCLAAFGILKAYDNREAKRNKETVNDVVSENKETENTKEKSKELISYLEKQNSNLNSWASAIKDYNSVMQNDPFQSESNKQIYVTSVLKIKDTADTIKSVEPSVESKEVQDGFNKAMDLYIEEMDLRLEVINLYEKSNVKEYESTKKKAEEISLNAYNILRETFSKFSELNK